MEQMLGVGIELEDGRVSFDKLLDEGGEGFNHWYRVMLKEGRNRIVRRTFEALGLTVSRLIRVRFGLINLPPRLKRGMTAELGTGEVEQVLEWVGLDQTPLVESDEIQNVEVAPIPPVFKPLSSPKKPVQRGRAGATGHVQSRQFNKNKTKAGVKR